MASTGQITKEITTASAPHSPSANTITKSLEVARSIERPGDATFTFAQQNAPLLRIPGELRNRIYHELFQPVFDKFEVDKELNGYYDPKVLCPALASLTACRQIHHEAMAVLSRAYIAEKPSWWYLQGRIASFFTRTVPFYRILKRYTPELHLAVRYLSLGHSKERITPACTKLFLEELACQVQQDVRITFTQLSHSSGGNTLRTKNSDAAVWDALWNKIGTSYFRAKGSVGDHRFTYLWFLTPNGMAHHGSLRVQGCLTQLNWAALEQSYNAAQMCRVQECGR